MPSALRLTLVWLLALLVMPIGSGPSEREPSQELCSSWCPCDEAERVLSAEHDETHDGEESPCEEDCGEDCSGCCDARTPVAVGLEGLPSTHLRAVCTGGPPLLDTPGCRVAAGVFRPPRSLA